MSQVEVSDRTNILLVVTEPLATLGSQRLNLFQTTFASALKINPERLQVVSATEQVLPNTVTADGIIFTGSSASAYDTLPWIDRLEGFIRAMDQQKKPMLGVCFGHQIVAQALRGKVEKGNKGMELGAKVLTLTTGGINDPLYRGLPATFEVAMTHGDVVTQIPESSIVLAKNSTYPNQSLAFGEHIRTVQFHPEMTIAELEKISGSPVESDLMETHGKIVLANFLRFFAAPYHQA